MLHVGRVVNVSSGTKDDCSRSSREMAPSSAVFAERVEPRVSTLSDNHHCERHTDLPERGGECHDDL